MFNLNEFTLLLQDVDYTFGALGVFISQNKALSGSRFNKSLNLSYTGNDL